MKQKNWLENKEKKKLFMQQCMTVSFCFIYIAVVVVAAAAAVLVNKKMTQLLRKDYN